MIEDPTGLCSFTLSTAHLSPYTELQPHCTVYSYVKALRIVSPFSYHSLPHGVCICCSLYLECHHFHFPYPILFLANSYSLSQLSSGIFLKAIPVTLITLVVIGCELPIDRK